MTGICVDQIGFVPVAAEHYPLLRKWLAQPHMLEWWGDPEEEFGFIRAMVEGQDTTRPFLIALHGEPVGYIQYWFIGHHQNEPWTKNHPWLLDLPSDAIGVDVSLGEPDKLSRGIGSAALAAFVGGLRAEGYTTIVDPDPANLRAVRAYEKAGFRKLMLTEAHDGPVLLMVHEAAQ